MKSWQFSLENLINQLIQDKSFSFIVCLGEAMSGDSMKTAAFHENRTKDHQLPGMVTLCFHPCTMPTYFYSMTDLLFICISYYMKRKWLHNFSIGNIQRFHNCQSYCVVFSHGIKFSSCVISSCWLMRHCPIPIKLS